MSKTEKGIKIAIDRNVRQDDPQFPAIKRFAEARMDGRMEDVRDLFAPDVTLVAYTRGTFHGVDSVLSFWQERHDSQAVRNTRFSFAIVPCMLINGIAFQEQPEGFATMFTTFIFKDGRISLMSLAPKYFSIDFRYYGSFCDAPYCEDYFSGYYTGDLKPKADRLPCPFCGELSENLEWHSFDHHDYDHFNGYRGEVSVCPHCHRTVELAPSERYSRSEEARMMHPRPLFFSTEKPIVQVEFDKDGLVHTAIAFAGLCIPRLVKRASRQGGSVDDVIKLFLPHVSVPEHLALKLSLASEDRDDLGDVSRFELREKRLVGSRTIASEMIDIIPNLIVERSLLGAWEAYLLLKAQNLLPTYWHGGYAAQNLILGPEDLEALPSQLGRATDVMTKGEDIRPKAWSDGGAVLVESCYWSEWGGLFRETVRFTFDGNRIVDIEAAEPRNLYMYDCGIMF